MKTLESQYLLGFMAGRNVLPKYGFPVDVVPLKTNHLPSKEARQVELDRDLRIAISEFAPGSGVVAAKKTWTSQGLYLLPNRALPEVAYTTCESCKRFDRTWRDLDVRPVWRNKTKIRGTTATPRYGFAARDPESRQLGEERPTRLYASRVFFASAGNDADAREPILRATDGTPLSLARFSRRGELAVVNNGRRPQLSLLS